MTNQVECDLDLIEDFRATLKIIVSELKEKNYKEINLVDPFGEMIEQLDEIGDMPYSATLEANCTKIIYKWFKTAETLVNHAGVLDSDEFLKSKLFTLFEHIDSINYYDDDSGIYKKQKP